MRNGRIIFLNGTSSSGKTTLAQALRESLSEPFCYYASDQLADSGFRPTKTELHSPTGITEREKFFDGFHRSILAFTEAGNDMIVEHIVEEPGWAKQLETLFAHLDVFWVGVHAPEEVLDQRERARGDRAIGEAKFHLKTHTYCDYDFEVDTTQTHQELVNSIIQAWQDRS